MSTINVTTYGATGNGSTDDTAAIQAAFNAAIAGDTVLFPSGTYMLDVLAVPVSGIIIEGASRTTVILRKTIGGTNQSMIKATGKNDLTFQNFTMDGQGPSQPWWIGNPYANTNPSSNITILEGSGHVLQNLYLYDASMCGYQLVGVTNFTISDVKTLGCGLSSQVVVGPGAGTGSPESTTGTITRCTSLDCESDGFTIEATGVTLTDCVANGAKYHADTPDQFAGFYFVGSSDITLIRCGGTNNSNRTFDADNASGTGTSDFQFLDCWGHGNGHEGAIPGTSGFLFQRCRFWDNPDSGIKLRGTDHTFKDCHSNAVYGTQSYGFTGSADNTTLINCDLRNNTIGAVNPSVPSAPGYSETGILSESNYPIYKERNGGRLISP